MKREYLNPEKVDKLGQKVVNQRPTTTWEKVRTKPWLEKGPGDKLRTNIPENDKAS